YRAHVLDLLVGGALAQALDGHVGVGRGHPELVDEAGDVALARQLGEEHAAVLLELRHGEAEVRQVAPGVLAAPDLDVQLGDVGLELRDPVLRGPVHVEVPEGPRDQRQDDGDDRDVALTQLAEAEVAEPHRWPPEAASSAMAPTVSE